MKKVLCLFLMLVGCGFSPLYHHENHLTSQNIQVNVQPIPNQHGFTMRQIIEKQMPNPIEPIQNRYTLIVQAPTFSGYDQTITNNDFASIIQVSAQTQYQLKNDKNKVVLSQNISAVSSYSVVNSPYATIVAKNKVEKELAEELANQVSMDVLTFLTKDIQ